jgi:hypothetical protein
MLTDSDPIFAAALALPIDLRGELAAKLLESLDDELGPSDDRTPEDWAQIINERSDSLHRDDSDLIDGAVALEMIQAAIDRAAAKK